MTRIVVADDHAVLREGVRALLNSIEGWQVVAEAADGLEALTLVEQHAPDLLVIDIGMPGLGGVEAIARLKKDSPQVLVVVLSARDDEFAVNDAMKAGANAYVTKSSGIDELQFAIRAVLNGQKYLSPAACSAALSGDGSSPIAALSDREREVLKLLAEGHPNREVAKLLHISARTVDSHRANILKKLGAGTNAELVQIAMKYKLIE